jgi:4-amino-4-deoxy-L-arabinose transferase-like glycosyltransferase
MSKRLYLILVLGLLLFQLLLAGYAPPASDELYYWCWSQELQLSYYDHAPLTAYMIRLSTEILGDTVFAIRLPACLCMFATLLLLGRMTRPLTPLGWVLLTPPYCLFAVVITPDAPLMCFWTAYVVWLAALHERLADPQGVGPSRWWWLAGGVLLGLGILSKYTMGLAGGAAALSLLGVRPWRKWATGFVLHGAVAFAVSLPILIYNLQVDFAPFRYQWQHVMESESPTVRYLPEFIGGQILAVGLLPLLLTPWLLRRGRSLSADPRLRACLYLFLVPTLFFLYKAARGKVELNWPIMCYGAFWPLAARWFEEVRGRALFRRLGYAAFAVPVGATILLTWHVLSPLRVVPPKQDRVTRCESWQALARAVGRTVDRLDPGAPVLAETYQLTSYLRFQHLDAQQIPGASRPSHFTQKPFPVEQQSRFFVVCEGLLASDFFPGFRLAEVTGEFPLVTRGQQITKFLLLRYQKQSENTHRVEGGRQPS